MKKSLILTSVILFALSAPAMAFHCPADVAKIDAALTAMPDISVAELAEVTKLRNEGEAYHKAGKHQDAVDTLAKALTILGE